MIYIGFSNQIGKMKKSERSHGEYYCLVDTDRVHLYDCDGYEFLAL